MKTAIKTSIALLLAALTVAACSSPEARRDPFNSPDSQRSRAGQSQDEMSRDTSK